METRLILIALPFVAFITFVATWGVCYLRTQIKNQKRQADLEAKKSILKQVQSDMTELESKFNTLSEEKISQDIAYGRLEADRDSLKKQVERLENDCLAMKMEMDALRQTQQQDGESRAKALEAADKLNDQLESARTAFKEQIEERDLRCAQVDQKLTEANVAKSNTAKQLAECREAFKKVQTQREEKQELLSSYKEWWEQAKTDLKSTEDKYNGITNTCMHLITSLNEKQQHFDEKIKLLQERNETLTKMFGRLDNEIDDWLSS